MHAVKMVSRLRLGLGLDAFFPARSIRSRSSRANIEGVGRQKEEETIGEPRRTSVSITCHRLSDEQRRFTRAHSDRYYAKRAELLSSAIVFVWMRLLRRYKFMLRPERKMRAEIVNTAKRRGRRRNGTR